MKNKESKAIKRLEKQLEKLNARVDDMSREIKTLQISSISICADRIAIEPEDDYTQTSSPAAMLSKQMVDTITEAAEEFDELSGSGKKGKKARRG
jgi:TolA-binding protein